MTPQKCTLKEMNDGSGDFFVEIPEEFLKALNIKEGDLVNIETINGIIHITKAKKESQHD